MSNALAIAGVTAVLKDLLNNGLIDHNVTGAVGGVGSVAVALLAKAGWHVIAATGRPEEADYLKGLGAAEIIERGFHSRASGAFSGENTTPLPFTMTK